MDVSRVSGRIRKKSSKLADSFTGDGDEAADEQQQQLTAGEESPIEDLDDLQEADYDIREEDFDQIPGELISTTTRIYFQILARFHDVTRKFGENRFLLEFVEQKWLWL